VVGGREEEGLEDFIRMGREDDSYCLGWGWVVSLILGWKYSKGRLLFHLFFFSSVLRLWTDLFRISSRLLV